MSSVNVNYNTKLSDGFSAFNSTPIVQQAYAIANAPFAPSSSSSTTDTTNNNSLLNMEQQLMSQFQPAGVSGLDTSA